MPGYRLGAVLRMYVTDLRNTHFQSQKRGIVIKQGRREGSWKMVRHLLHQGCEDDKRLHQSVLLGKASLPRAAPMSYAPTKNKDSKPRFPSIPLRRSDEADALIPGIGSSGVAARPLAADDLPCAWMPSNLLNADMVALAAKVCHPLADQPAASFHRHGVR